MDKTRLTIQKAARALGVSEGAIRKRVNRGTLEHDRDEDGRIFVYVDAATHGLDDVQDEVSDPNSGALISSLQSEVEFLRGELERRGDEADRYQQIVAGLAQSNADLSARVRELESPETGEDEPQGSAESAEGVSPRPDEREPHSDAQEPQARRSTWWRRLVGR